MTREIPWTPNRDGFDPENGGALYIAEHPQGTGLAAGYLWLDATGDQLPFYAFAASFELGADRYGDVVPASMDDVPDAFCDAIDSDVVEEIGSFATGAEALCAVEDYVLRTASDPDGTVAASARGGGRP